MAGFLDNLLNGSRQLAHNEIQKIIEVRYFPEIWYLVESWLSTAKGKKILDIGCGDGRVSEALAKTDWDVLCVDHDLNSLMALQKNFAKNNLKGRFEQSNSDAVPVSSSSFAACSLINTLEFSQHPSKVLQEVFRVLRPGGKAIIATFNRTSLWGASVVAGSIRRRDTVSVARCLSKHEFVTLLKQSPFKVDGFVSRARYFPISLGLRKVKIPITGCYVALVTKPYDDGKKSEDGATRVSKM